VRTRGKWIIESMNPSKRRQAYFATKKTVIKTFRPALRPRAREILKTRHIIPEAFYYTHLGRADPVVIPGGPSGAYWTSGVQAWACAGKDGLRKRALGFPQLLLHPGEPASPPPRPACGGAAGERWENVPGISQEYSSKWSSMSARGILTGSFDMTIHEKYPESPPFDLEMDSREIYRTCRTPGIYG
jgi:hypothetical protein